MVIVCGAWSSVIQNYDYVKGQTKNVIVWGFKKTLFGGRGVNETKSGCWGNYVQINKNIGEGVKINSNFGWRWGKKKVRPVPPTYFKLDSPNRKH